MKKRSLVELDTVIDELIARNPWFEQAVDKIIKESKNDRLHSRSRSSGNQIHRTVEKVSSRANDSSRAQCKGH